MNTDVLAPPAPAVAMRPSQLRLVAMLTGHALKSFVRTPTASFFTLIFPLSFLAIVGSTVGGQEVGVGIRVSQFLVAPFIVFGVAEGAFCVLAIGTATLRESGVLKRLHGAPAPSWAVVSSRVAAAAVMSLLSAVILVVVGVLAYDVRVVWSKAPAALVTLMLGIACCAALGLAVVSLTRSVLAAQAMTNGVLIPLAFISHVFIPGMALPVALDWLSLALPLRHFADALQTTFDPLTRGGGFVWTDLAALAGWTVAGAVVAVWRFGWEPRGGGAGRPTAVATRAEREPASVATVLTPRVVGRPRLVALLAGQAVHVLTGMRREKLPVFFAVVFPALLLLLFPAVIPAETVRGMRFADALLPGMVAYAIAVAAYVNLPEEVAHVRGAGVLKRLRGSPLPPWTYLLGRLLGSLVVAVAATVVLVVVAVIANGYQVSAARLPALALGVVLTAACFGALGLALLTIMPAARSVNAITLGTLVPLSFVSDVFYIGAELPHQLQLAGDVFPLKHSVGLFVAALQPGASGYGLAWSHIAIVCAWTVAASLVATRFPWSDRSEQ